MIKKVAYYLYKNGFAVITITFPTIFVTTVFFKKPSTLDIFLSSFHGKLYFYMVVICHVSWLIYKGIEKMEQLSKKKKIKSEKDRM